MSDFKGQVVITIQSPVETVYAYLSDFTRHSEWAQNIGKITPITTGPVAVGSRFRSDEGPPPVRTMQKLKMMIQFMRGVIGGAKPYSEAKITALEPHHRIAWEAGIPKGDGFFNFAEWEFLLEPQGNATHLIQRFHWKPQTPTAERMVSAAGVEGLENAVAVSLRQLKRRLES